MASSDFMEMLKAGGCEEKKALNAFTAVLEGRRKDIRQTLVNNASRIFPRYLKDFDWSLKVGSKSSHILL